MNNNPSPLISVIVPCYNRVKYLNECFGSLLNQTYPNWECIIINDGSLDNTEEAAQEWIRKDTRFKYFSKENGGTSSARNMGLQMAKGDFIQFLDSDDTISNNKFELQLQLMRRRNADIIFSGYDFLLNTKLYNNDYSDRVPVCTVDGFIYGWDTDFVIPPHSALISRTFLNNNNIVFHENIKGKEDWLFLIECSLKNADFFYHADKLAHYRMHNSNKTKNYEQVAINNYRVFLEIYDFLNKEQKEKYKLEMPVILHQQIRENYGRKEMQSLTFRTGNFVLAFPKLVKRLLFKGSHTKT